MLSRVKKLLRYVLTSVKYTLNQIFGNNNYQKFVVITRSRTGSNFLMASLNSHPNIEAHRELFRELNGKSCSDIWDRTFSKKAPWINRVGFKIFYYHPLDSNDRSVWDRLVEDKQIKVIHLKRDNLLRTVLSGKIALKTKIWTKKVSNSQVKLEDKKMTLDVKECIDEFEKIRKWESSIDQQFSNHSKMDISYENLVTDPQVLKQVLNFLDVSSSNLNTSHRKQNKEMLSELIENYDQFSSELDNTEWGYLLRE